MDEVPLGENIYGEGKESQMLQCRVSPGGLVGIFNRTRIKSLSPQKPVQ